MRRFPLVALLLVVLPGCAGCDSSRLDESAPAASMLAARSASVLHDAWRNATTTTVVPTPQRAGASHTAAERASRAAPIRVVMPAPPSLDVLLDRLAMCESHRNPRAVSSNGKFFGAFQDTLQTWRAIGGTGNPIDHDYATQKALNGRIPVSSWHRQFPVCSRRIGV